MNSIMTFLDSRLTPLAAKFGENRYLRSISSGFIAVMSATIVGSIFTLISNLPIKAWTDWLASSGFGKILALPSQATIDLIAVYAVFFIAYNLAKEFEVDGAGAGLSALVSFFLLTGRTPFYTKAATDAATEMAYSASFLGARGLFTAILVALIGGRIFIWVVQRGWVIKLPDSVPPNVGNSFSALIPAGFVITIFLVVAGLMTLTSYGNLNVMIFTVIQSNLMRFMGNNLFSWIFFELVLNILWLFGLHGGNIVNSITNPVYTPLALENLAAYEAGAELPYIFTGQSFRKTFTSGGVGSMFGFAIVMVLFAKSKQYKVMGKLSLPTTAFFINEPLLFGLPVVLNPIYVIPLVFTTPVLGTITYFAMKLNLIPISAGLQLPFTTPPILHGFLQGGIRLAIWELIMIFASAAIWYPFFKLGDKKACLEEHEIEE